MLYRIILKEEPPNERVEKNRNRYCYRDRWAWWAPPWRAAFDLLRGTQFRLDCRGQSRASTIASERCRGGAAHVATLSERQVAGDDGAPALVALAEDLEQQLGPGL